MPEDSYTLVSILGIGDYQECRYSLDGAVSRPGRFAPLLEIDVLSARERRCSALHVLLTAEAAAIHQAAFTSELAAQHSSVSVVFHLIPKGASRGEIDTVFQKVVDIVADSPAAQDILVDITHGFRSLGLVVVSALRFATMALERTLGGILYGAFEAKDENGVAPVFDLTTLVTLDEWAAAARDFSRSYDTSGLAALVTQRRKEIQVQAKDVRDLQVLGSVLRSGLPLEAGMIANGLHHSGLAQRIQALAPPAKSVSLHLTETLRGLSLTAWIAVKADIPLTTPELKRQERLVESSLAQGDLGRALRLAREYAVNRVLVARDQAAHWLKVHVRNEASADLKAMAKLCALSSQAWHATQAIMDDRNALAHCGYDDNKIDPVAVLGRFRTEWELIRSQPDEFFRIPRSKSGKD